jgi:hypothetical protein
MCAAKAKALVERLRGLQPIAGAVGCAAEGRRVEELRRAQKAQPASRLTVVDGPVDDHLEEEKVAVSVPPSPEAPGQGASQPPRQ